MNGMTVNDLIAFLKLTSDQKETLVVSLGAPLASGVILLVGLDPALVASTSFLNLCVLAIVAILPVWLLNELIWSALSVCYTCALAKQAIHCLHIPPELKEVSITGLSELLARLPSVGAAHTKGWSYCYGFCILFCGRDYLFGGSIVRTSVSCPCLNQRRARDRFLHTNRNHGPASSHKYATHILGNPPAARCGRGTNHADC